MSSQWWFNFTWIVLLSQPPRSSQSVSDPCIFEDNQTLSLRDVDPVADGGVWPILRWM